MEEVLKTVFDFVSEAEISKLARPSNYRLGETIFKNGEVELIEFTPVRVVARVAGGQRRQVEFTAAENGLQWACSCTIKQRHIFCKHCASLALAIAAKQGV